MQENKLKLYATALIALSVVLAAAIIGNAFKYKFVATETISTTGLAEKEFTSDMVTWSAKFKTYSMNRKEAYDQLKIDANKIKQYLIQKGITEKEIVFSAIDIEERTKTQRNYGGSDGFSETSVFAGYELSQTFEIESKALDIVEKTSREITELIEQGIDIVSFKPSFSYTKLDDLKLELIANATKNATSRAQNIAKESDSRLGNLRNASMGVFQITGKSSSEEFSWGGVYNTTDRNKKASITVKLEFGIK